MRLVSRWKLLSLLPKTPRNRFSEKPVSSPNFFTKPPPHQFLGPNELCGSFRGENSTRFCLKHPRNRFSKKHVFGPNLFTKLPPHLFSGPNGLHDLFWGKNCARFLPKTPPKAFFQKIRFQSEFFYVTAPTYFRGQTDLLRLGPITLQLLPSYDCLDDVEPDPIWFKFLSRIEHGCSKFL